MINYSIKDVWLGFPNFLVECWPTVGKTEFWIFQLKSMVLKLIDDVN